MRKLLMLTALVLQCTAVTSTFAAINFGSQDSTLKTTGGTLALNDGPSLEGGTINDSGGSITADTSLSMSEMTVTSNTTSSTANYEIISGGGDGATVTWGTTIALGDEDVLQVGGGQVAEAVTAGGASAAAASVVRGHGSFGSTVAIDANDFLNVEWAGAFNTDVDMGASSTLTLLDDLTFSGVNKPDGTGTVNFNGYKMTFDKGVTIDDTQTWQTPNVAFRGNATVSGTLELNTGDAYLNGHGNDIQMDGTMTLASGIDGTIADATLTAYDAGALASNDTNWTLDNVTLRNGATSIRVTEGALDGTASNVLAGAGTWAVASDIELLSDFTMAGAWTMGAAGTVINGNNHEMNVNGGGFATGTTGITLSNVMVSGLAAAKLNGDRTYTLNNVSFQKNSSSEAFRVLDGTLDTNSTGTDADPFTAAVDFGSANIELLADVTPGAAWAVTGDNNVIAGNGYKLNIANALTADTSAAVTLSDVYLSGIPAAGGLAGTDVVWNMNNVVLDNGTSVMRIVDGTITEANTDNNADIFNIASEANPRNVKLENVNMELIEDVADGKGDWVTNNTNLTINGLGNSLSLLSAGRGIAGGSGTVNFNNVKLLVGSTNSSSGTWNFQKTILEDTNGDAVSVDGAMTSSDFNLLGSAATISADTKISLLSDITPSNTWTSNGVTVDGNGFALNCGGSGKRFDLAAGTLSFANITLAEVVAATFDADTAQALSLQNVKWYGNDASEGALLVHGAHSVDGSQGAASLTLATAETAGDLFSGTGTAVWGTTSGVSMSLLSNTTLAGEWNFAAASNLNGNGNALKFTDTTGTINYDGALYLNDITLTNVSDASFDNAGGQDLFLNKVTWNDGSNGAIISASSEVDGAQYAQVTLATSATAGDLFGADVTWANGVHIKLTQNTQLGATWTFEDNSTIDGGGALFDVDNANSAVLKIKDGKTLTLQNMVLSNIHANTLFSNTGYETGTLILSNVTVKMNGNVDWSSKGTDLTINGPVTFITGQYQFDPQDAGSTIDGVTVWYDGLGQGGIVTDTFASKTNDGRVSAVAESSTGSVVFTPTANNVGDSLFLNYAVTSGSAGKQVDITNSSSWGTTELEGNGRSWYFGDTGENTTGFLVNISGGEVVTVNDLVIDNFNQGAIENNSEIKFGNGCLLRLNEDTALTAGLLLAGTESGEGITIDLCGNELDLGGQTVTITDTDATVTFKNGRITNVTGQPFAYTDGDFDGCTNTLVFEDVELVVSGATTFSAAATTFNGSSSITGKTDQTVSFFNSAVTIAAGATLTVDEGITIMLDEGDGSGHNAAAVDSSISFGSANSTLNLMGATMNTDLTTAPILQSGTVRIDDQVAFNGSWTVYQDTLDIDIAPGASLLVPASATFTAQDAPQD